MYQSHGMDPIWVRELLIAPGGIFDKMVGYNRGNVLIMQLLINKVGFSNLYCSGAIPNSANG